MVGKRKGAGNDVFMTLRLPRALHERLVAASGGRSVSEELRSRLEKSLEPLDPMTAELAAALTYAADDLQRDFAPWHEDRFAFEAFKDAITKVLRIYQPPGEPKVKFNPDGIANLIYPDDVAPEAVADILVRVALTRTREGRNKL